MMSTGVVTTGSHGSRGGSLPGELDSEEAPFKARKCDQFRVAHGIQKPFCK